MSRTYRCTIREPHSCPQKTYKRDELTRHVAAYKAGLARARKRNATAKGGKRRKPTETRGVQKPEVYLKICKNMAKIFRSINRVNRLAEVIIPKPKIPNTLSEPIVFHLLNKKKIIPKLSKYDLNIGGEGADILATRGRSRKKIQVKGTGSAEFITMGPKDIVADHFIWLNFGTAFEKDDFSKLILIQLTRSLTLKHYPKLQQWYRDKEGKINLTQFKEKIGRGYIEWEINLNTRNYSAVRR